MINYLKLANEKYSNKVAIVCEEEKLTFAQLYDRVMKMSERFVVETSPVILIENVRNIDTIVCMLAAVAAGKAYRLVNMSETEDKDLTVINSNVGKVLYQVCTSGTTGRKKLINKDMELFKSFMLEFADKMEISYEDVILNQLEFTFDASAKDIYLMVITGATLCIGSREKLNFPAGFMELITKNKVTVFQTTPYFIKNICRFDGFAKNAPNTLRRVMFVGDVMKSEYLNYWISKMPDTKFVNLYGTSETIGNLMYYEVEGLISSEYVPLTKTFCDYEPYINEESVLCFNGVDGEKIVTGDMARYDNGIVIEGRVDNIRKIRGYRVSLEEIEMELSKVLGGNSVLCEIADDEIYAIFEGNEQQEIRKLQMEVKKLLPKHLWQIKSKQVKELPVNANGKPNRKKITEYF